MLYSIFSWKNFIFIKSLMELLMENKEKAMDDYLI